MKRTAQGCRDACRRRQMACEGPSIKQFLKSRTDKDEDHRADGCAKSDHQKNCSGDGIMDKFKRPRQADEDNQRQREYADNSVNQDRVGCARPAGGTPTSEQPNSRTIAANGRGQYLIKKCRNKT
jgi:hypothetical protein